MLKIEEIVKHSLLLAQKYDAVRPQIAELDNMRAQNQEDEVAIKAFLGALSSNLTDERRLWKQILQEACDVAKAYFVQQTTRDHVLQKAYNGYACKVQKAIEESEQYSSQRESVLSEEHRLLLMAVYYIRVMTQLERQIPHYDVENKTAYLDSLNMHKKHITHAYESFYMHRSIWRLAGLMESEVRAIEKKAQAQKAKCRSEVESIAFKAMTDSRRHDIAITEVEKRNQELVARHASIRHYIDMCSLTSAPLQPEELKKILVSQGSLDSKCIPSSAGSDIDTNAPQGTAGSIQAVGPSDEVPPGLQTPPEVTEATSDGYETIPPLLRATHFQAVFPLPAQSITELSTTSAINRGSYDVPITLTEDISVELGRKIDAHPIIQQAATKGMLKGLQRYHGQVPDAPTQPEDGSLLPSVLSRQVDAFERPARAFKRLPLPTTSFRNTGLRPPSASSKRPASPKAKKRETTKVEPTPTIDGNVSGDDSQVPMRSTAVRKLPTVKFLIDE